MSFVQYYLTANVLVVNALLLMTGLRAVCARLRRPRSFTILGDRGCGLA